MNSQEIRDVALSLRVLAAFWEDHPELHGPGATGGTGCASHAGGGK